MPEPDDHPLRYALVNELHARPFPAVAAPCEAVFVAVKPASTPAQRDRAADHAQLLALLDRHGAPHPEPGATHHSAQLGRSSLKWESHTEFVTYSVFSPDLSPRAFDPALAEVFAPDWLATGPGGRIAAVSLRVEILPDRAEDILPRLDAWFVPESLVVTWVVDRAAVVAGDFRIDAAGQMRFAVFVRPGTGPDRVGRILQRLCEIETYRAMSMLGLGRARDLTARLDGIEPRLSTLVATLSAGGGSAEETLGALLGISAELEDLALRNSFRFGATGAYEAIVLQRIAVLREDRFADRQTLTEFFTRRYDPAMRTVKSAERRLQQLTDRAQRAGELLRTRVDVERQAQNQRLLASMDKRADMALRLQHTVEGLSVVAVSYYAVSLLSYLLLPLADAAKMSKIWLTALLVPPVVAGVWLMVRRIRRRMG